MREDNTGFVHFPNPSNRHLIKMDTGKTLVYLVAFDPQDMSDNPYELSNTHLFMPGTFVGDDVMVRPSVKPKSLQMSIDELIDEQVANDEYDTTYFPNLRKNTTVVKDIDRLLSIPMMSSICLGWSEYTYEVKDDIGFWFASFRDLTNEGKKLYYSMKKLNNTKEVRILTFNSI